MSCCVAVDRMGSTAPKELSVTIVARSLTTLASLQGYLRAAGIVTGGTRSVDRILEATPPTCAAVILFADEYATSGVMRALTALHRARPAVLPVIVTNDPLRFGGRPRQRAGGLPPVVIAKPPWAWTLLDAVRARLESSESPSGVS